MVDMLASACAIVEGELTMPMRGSHAFNAIAQGSCCARGKDVCRGDGRRKPQERPRLGGIRIVGRDVREAQQRQLVGHHVQPGAILSNGQRDVALRSGIRINGARGGTPEEAARTPERKRCPASSNNVS